jgi:hypothetical protein
MDQPSPARVLVVTGATPVTPALLRAVGDRASRGPARFRVLVPNPAPAEWHPLHPRRHDTVERAERLLAHELPRIQDVADDAVRGRVSTRHDPMAAIEELLQEESFDEIILAMTTHHPQRLARRVAHLGLAVTTVEED